MFKAWINEGRNVFREADVRIQDDPQVMREWNARKNDLGKYVMRWLSLANCLGRQLKGNGVLPGWVIKTDQTSHYMIMINFCNEEPY